MENLPIYYLPNNHENAEKSFVQNIFLRARTSLYASIPTSTSLFALSNHKPNTYKKYWAFL